jgi:hypothetical protein
MKKYIEPGSIAYAINSYDDKPCGIDKVIVDHIIIDKTSVEYLVLDYYTGEEWGDTTTLVFETLDKAVSMFKNMEQKVKNKYEE